MEDAVAHEGGEGAAGDPFDESGEEDVVAVGVAEAGAGRIARGGAAESADGVAEVVNPVVAAAGDAAVVASGQPAGVFEEVADGDGGGVGVDGFEIGEAGGEGKVEIQRPFALKPGDGEGGEGLADRSQFDESPGRHRIAGFEAADAVGAERDFGAADEGDGDAGEAVQFHLGADVPVERGREGLSRSEGDG